MPVFDEDQGENRREDEDSRGVTPRTLARVVVFFFGVILCGSSALSQTVSQKWEVFAEGGASLMLDRPINSFSDEGTIRNTIHVPTSGRLFIGFRYWFNDHEALEGSYSYTPTDIVATSGCEDVFCGETMSVSKARTSFFSANYVRSLRAHGLVRPFLTVGVGALYLHCLGPNPCVESNPFAANLGGGVDIRLGRNWSLRVEDRDWLFEGIRMNDFYSEGATGLTHNQVPSLGFVYRF